MELDLINWQSVTKEAWDSLKETTGLIATFLFMILNFLLDTASFPLWQGRSEMRRLFQVIKQMLSLNAIFNTAHLMMKRLG